MWFWENVDVFVPSIYPRFGPNATAQTDFVYDKVEESIRLAKQIRNSTGRVVGVFPYARAFVYGTYNHQEPPNEQPPFPLTSADLAATIQLPAALGADGVILWGSSSDVRNCSECQVIESYIESTGGPRVQKCIENRAKCSKTYCNGHGHCQDWSADMNVEDACMTQTTLDNRETSVPSCRCFAGWSGDGCEKKSL